MLREVLARSALLRAAAVCFDVDSTLILDEGIDVLAATAGRGAEVAALTAAAMGGAVPFEAALRQRLAAIRPSRQLVADCLRDHPPRLTPGAAELVALLHARGTLVFLVSGGFTDMVAPVADALGVPRARVFANRLLFDPATGAFAGHDETAFTARSHGKAAAVAFIRDALLPPGSNRVVVAVGDGATDMEARVACDAFIGFGGVVERAAVRAGADWYVTSFSALIALLRDAPRAPAKL
jgi:phosphoserine phosphatase